MNIFDFLTLYDIRVWYFNVTLKLSGAGTATNDVQRPPGAFGAKWFNAKKDGGFEIHRIGFWSRSPTNFFKLWAFWTAAEIGQK